MKISNLNFIIWLLGLIMPALFAGIDCVLNSFGVSMSGALLYVSIFAGALLCTISILEVKIPLIKRILFVFASWTLLYVEVLLLGIFLLAKQGITGIQ